MPVMFKSSAAPWLMVFIQSVSSLIYNQPPLKLGFFDAKSVRHYDATLSVFTSDDCRHGHHLGYGHHLGFLLLGFRHHGHHGHRP